MLAATQAMSDENGRAGEAGDPALSKHHLSNAEKRSLVASVAKEREMVLARAREVGPRHEAYARTTEREVLGFALQVRVVERSAKVNGAVLGATHAAHALAW